MSTEGDPGRLCVLLALSISRDRRACINGLRLTDLAGQRRDSLP